LGTISAFAWRHRETKKNLCRGGRSQDEEADDDDDDDDNNNHVPKSVETGREGKFTILWNQQGRTDRTIANSKPDVIIRVDKKGMCVSIDVAIAGDRNVIKKEAGKILKYKDLIIEIQRICNVTAKSDTINNSGDWNHFQITETIPEHHTGKARN
jgi:hypothetical protein